MPPSVSDIIARRFNSRHHAIEDSFNTLNRNTINSISKLFGNTVSLIEGRKDRMYQDRTAKKKVLAHHLQTGDTLLEKNPFRLIDRMIPRYWTCRNFSGQ